MAMIELERRTRPYFDIVAGANRIHTMLDTGADFSVYTKDIETLKTIFPNLITTDAVAYISGFGGNVGKSRVYVIPELVLGDIRYVHIPIVCIPNDKLSAELVLASNILSSSPFTIDYSKRILNITKVRDTVWCNYICEFRDTVKENVWVKTSVLIQE